MTAERKDFLLMNLGILCTSIGINFFNNPNKFALGGIAGFSIVLRYFFSNLPVGAIMLIINIFLLIISAFILGKESAKRSAYGSLLLSILVLLLEKLFYIPAPLTNQRFMELIYGVFLPGIGSALVFNAGATTGGTDIIAQILSKYLGIKVSLSLLMIDFSIAASAGALYGAEVFLFSCFGVALKIFVLDTFLESLHVFKIVVVISVKSHEIQQFIINNLKRGATVHAARGAFTVLDKEVITTVLNRRQARSLQRYINEIDPGAFITISNSSQIIGKGFH